MCPNYDYKCRHCGKLFVAFAKYDDRDGPQKCGQCGSNAGRVYATVPQVRTAKLSKTFVDGTRPKSEGFDEWKKIAKLEKDHADAKTTEEKKQIKKEINDRKTIKK